MDILQSRAGQRLMVPWSSCSSSSAQQGRSRAIMIKTNTGKEKRVLRQTCVGTEEVFLFHI
jgi:hypothetical protein